MEKPSKTQKKQEALSLQDLGAKLLELDGEELKAIGLPERIFDAVVLAKSIKKHGALKRQVQYIGSLMRKIDPAPIEAAVRSREEKSREQADLHKKVEGWRNELINGNDALARELMKTLPEEEKFRFVELLEKARAEAARTKPDPAPSRMVFRVLHALATKDGDEKR